jgi:ubiquitin-conjugating enzyme E2 G2
MKEYRDLTADPINDTLTAGPVSEDNMLEWEALIQGPEDTPYVSGPEAVDGRVVLAG